MNKINKILGYIVLLLFIVGIANAVPVEEWNRTYNVGRIESSQQTGENWLHGTVKPIKWTSSGIGPKVEIELWKGSPLVFDRLLGHLIRNNGSWNWTIPSTVVARNDYRIKIWACAGNATACYYPYIYIGDMSDNNFRIS